MPDLDVAASFDVGVSLDSLASEIKRYNDRAHRLAQAIHPFSVPPSPIALSSGTGTLSQPNISGPQMSNYWDVHRIAAMGFTAGSVTVYLNAVGGDPVAYLTAQGVYYFGKGQVMLTGNDNLVFYATNITGTVAMALGGTEIAAHAIGDYLL